MPRKRKKKGGKDGVTNDQVLQNGATACSIDTLDVGSFDRNYSGDEQCSSTACDGDEGDTAEIGALSQPPGVLQAPLKPGLQPVIAAAVESASNDGAFTSYHCDRTCLVTGAVGAVGALKPGLQPAVQPPMVRENGLGSHLPEFSQQSQDTFQMPQQMHTSQMQIGQLHKPQPMPALQTQEEQFQQCQPLAAPVASNAQGVGPQQAVQPAGAPQAVPTHSNPWPLDDFLTEKYETIDMIGVGAYGTVYKAYQRDTRRVVAIKKIKTEEEQQVFQQGVPATVIREVACLRDLIHPNVVELIDVHMSGVTDYTLIFEFVEGDLHKMLKSFRNNQRKMGIELVRKYTLELLNGIHACHVRLILHRDLKPQNILIGPSGLKIGDFGLSRMFSLPLRNYSLDVVTLWYRAPEILLGCQRYGAEVDMWSAGCIIAEMAVGQAIFNGDSEIGTIFKIFKLCGTPSEETWPGLSALEHWKPIFPLWPSTNLKSIAEACPDMGEDGMELIRNLLILVPANRFHARKAKNWVSQCTRFSSNGQPQDGV